MQAALDFPCVEFFAVSQPAAKKNFAGVGRGALWVLASSGFFSFPVFFLKTFFLFDVFRPTISERPTEALLCQFSSVFLK